VHSRPAGDRARDETGLSFPLTREAVDVDVREVDSAEAWADVVSQCFVPLRTRSFEQSFTGRMEYERLDEAVAVSRVITSGTAADRDAKLASAANSDDLHISLQVSAPGVISQGGRSVRVAAGSVSTYATFAPYYLDYSAPHQMQTIVQVSQRALDLPTRMIEASCHRILTPPTSAARVLFGYVEEVRTGVDAHDGIDDTAATMRDLIATMIHSTFASSRVMPRTTSALRITVERYVHQHFADHGLDVDDIAAAHYISRRRLYQLFETVGTTPADLLRAVRLEAASERLRASDDASVSLIAFESGFSDATTFTRAFRRRYGCVPRDYRRTARGAVVEAA
jgi:AraC-like DNA-binding protein